MQQGIAIIIGILCAFNAQCAAFAHSDWVEDSSDRVQPPASQADSRNLRAASPQREMAQPLPDSDAANNSAQYRITRLEYGLFGQPYDKDGLERRLTRLEKCLLGHATRATLADRISLLESVYHEGSAGAKSAASPHHKSKEPTGMDRQRVDDLLAEAVSAFDAGDVSLARSRFEKVLEEEPSNADANFSLGNIAEETGELQEAARYYKIALAGKPNDHEIKQAVADIERKLQIRGTDGPKSPQYREYADLMTQATMDFKAGNYGSAKKILEQVVFSNPADAKAQFALGQSLRHIGDLDGAIYRIKEATKLAPNVDTYKKELKQVELEQDFLASGGHPRKVGNKPPGGLLPLDPEPSLSMRAGRVLFGTALGMGLGALAGSYVPGGWRTGMGLGGMGGGLVGLMSSR